MRLINVQTLAFEEFEGDATTDLKYGILSHRWREEEVTYHDAISTGLYDIQKKGIAKIKQVCKLALLSDLQYVWVDTCCIDKASSAELSEAINSMFRWYQQAHTCFAYLDDIDLGGAPELSMWFSRAWTLQELIAPQHVLFSDKDWEPLGSKADLADGISARTAIPHDVLKNKLNIYSLPVAQRMSWARRRSARRVEDIAYSLLGIFDVNMPLLYGEGSKAFRRLQEEIIKQNNDHTIFVWTTRANSIGRLLAPSPDSFPSNRVFHLRPSRKGATPFSITNLGLSIILPLLPWHSNTYLALLDCELASFETADTWRQPGLFLRRSRHSDLFEKVNFLSKDYGFLHEFDTNRIKTRDIHIALDTTATRKDSTKLSGNTTTTYLRTLLNEELYGFVLRSVEVHDGQGIQDILSECLISTKHKWDESDRTIEMLPGTAGDAVIVTLPEHPAIPSGISAVKLGFDFDFRPCCIIGVVRNDRSVDDHRDEHSPQAIDSWGTLAAIDLDKERGWLGLGDDHVIPLSKQSYWLLKGDALLGLSVLLGPPTNANQKTRDYCFAEHQISVRLTREPHRGKIAWMFDLQISPCPGTFCSSHKRQVDEDTLSAPEIVVSPAPHSMVVMNDWESQPEPSSSSKILRSKRSNLNMQRLIRYLT